MGKDLRGKELGNGISQQKNGTYCARFVDRSGKRRAKRSKKLQEVRQWLAESTYIDEHSSIDAGGDMTLDTWFGYWFNTKQKTIKPATAAVYMTRYQKYIKDAIGRKPVQRIKPIECQAILSEMADQGLRQNTIMLTRAIMKSIFEGAKDNGLIQDNPCGRAVTGKIGAAPKNRGALTTEEQRRLLRAMEGKNGCFENAFRFILQTGLRIGELSGLKWKDVDFKERTITISRTISHRKIPGADHLEWQEGTPKSQAGTRTIPLTDEAIRILKLQKENNLKIKVIPIRWADNIFIGKRGTPSEHSCYDKALGRYCRAAGIRQISPHNLRHSFASRAAMSGEMDPKILQQVLGHSKLATTMDLYVHVTEEEKRKQMERVADALNVV